MDPNWSLSLVLGATHMHSAMWQLTGMKGIELTTATVRRLQRSGRVPLIQNCTFMDNKVMYVG